MPPPLMPGPQCGFGVVRLLCGGVPGVLCLNRRCGWHSPKRPRPHGARSIAHKRVSGAGVRPAKRAAASDSRSCAPGALRELRARGGAAVVRLWS